MTTTRKTKPCDNCGKPLGTLVVRVRDAADVPHRMHPECWAALRWWLAGHAGKPPQRLVIQARKRAKAG